MGSKTSTGSMSQLRLLTETQIQYLIQKVTKHVEASGHGSWVTVVDSIRPRTHLQLTVRSVDGSSASTQVDRLLGTTTGKLEYGS